MHSTRVDDTDSCINGEGKQSHHLADGVTFIFRTREEYATSFPCWDWRKLPGITCAQSDQPLQPARVREHGATSFVGGLSDGTNGCAGIDFQRDELAAKKSWFFCDNSFLASGSWGFPCRRWGSNDLAEPVPAPGASASLVAPEVLPPSGARELEGIRWAWHDQVAYVFPKPQTVVMAGGSAGQLEGHRGGYVGRKRMCSVYGSLTAAAEKQALRLCGRARSGTPGRRTMGQDQMPRILANTPDLQGVRRGSLASGLLEAGRNGGWSRFGSRWISRAC